MAKWGNSRKDKDRASDGPYRVQCPRCNGQGIVPVDRAGAKPGETELCGMCDGDRYIDGPAN